MKFIFEYFERHDVDLNGTFAYRITNSLQTISSLAVVGYEIHDDFFDFPQMKAFVRYTLAWLSLTGTRISIEFNYYLLMKT